MSIYELLHGMMLPSGNDAAQTLAIFIGNLLLKIDNLQKDGKQVLIEQLNGDLQEHEF